MESAKRIESPAPLDLVAKLQDLHDASDTSIAELFCALHPDNYRYIRDAEYWMYWNKKAWAPDVKHQELLNCLGELRDGIRRLNSSAKTDIINQILNRLSGTRTKACAVTAISQMADISTLSSDWDAHPHLIAFQNCVYNTQTSQLIYNADAIRKLYLTQRISCKHDANAKCPKWLEFLSTIFLGDKDLIGFVQKLAGLSLSGNVQEELLIFAHGEGANGKSTFLNVLSEIFADYHVDIDPSILIKSRTNDQRLKLENTANLRGKRLATANEIPEMSSYDDSIVKQLSSRDPVPYKHIYQSAGSFIPSHTLWVRANHKPRFNVNDGGMLRRLVLIPFAHHFPPDNRINRYEDTLLKEAPGILNWLIEGFEEYRKNGLGVYPESVSKALDEYRTECDVLGQFMQDCYMKMDGQYQPLKNVLNLYNTWAPQNGYKTSNSRTLGQQLRAYGYKIELGRANQRLVRDIAPLSDDNEPPR
jgi:putative DNA primase/helicase